MSGLKPLVKVAFFELNLSEFDYLESNNQDRLRKLTDESLKEVNTRIHSFYQLTQLILKLKWLFIITDNWFKELTVYLKEMSQIKMFYWDFSWYGLTPSAM
jgi:hypothetical protein